MLVEHAGHRLGVVVVLIVTKAGRAVTRDAEIHDVAGELHVLSQDHHRGLRDVLRPHPERGRESLSGLCLTRQDFTPGDARSVPSPGYRAKKPGQRASVPRRIEDAHEPPVDLLRFRSCPGLDVTCVHRGRVRKTDGLDISRHGEVAQGDGARVIRCQDRGCLGEPERLAVSGGVQGAKPSDVRSNVRRAAYESGERGWPKRQRFRWKLR